MPEAWPLAPLPLPAAAEQSRQKERSRAGLSPGLSTGTQATQRCRLGPAGPEEGTLLPGPQPSLPPQGGTMPPSPQNRQHPCVQAEGQGPWLPRLRGQSQGDLPTVP